MEITTSAQRRSPRLDRLTPRERWRRIRLRTYGGALTGVYGLTNLHPAVWKYVVRTYRPSFDAIARRHARLSCAHAAVDVPAYRDLVRLAGVTSHRRLTDFPETTKDNYVTVYDETSRCRHGELDLVGTVVDESAGSSGRPFNWVRGRRELETVYRNASCYTELVFPSRRPFAINAFSMGAWATGTATGTAMARIAMVKNTGPDVDKIVDTLTHFGPGFDYVVSAYPPFLKHLRDRLDAIGFPWERYRIRGMVGGEPMTEALRDYLQERFEEVRSGYGASDLSIGIGAETGFTVWLRRQLMTDVELRRDLLGADEQRLPMIFQYNPLETFLEVNGRGELLCTVNSRHVLQPKLRYNVGDEARLAALPDVRKLIRRDPQRWDACVQATADERMSLPLLFLFGRRDSTISYMGANIYPQDVEYGLYADNPVAADIERFCLTIEEQADLEPRPVVNIELRAGATLDDDGRARLAELCRQGVLRHLARVSRDFAQSLAEDPTAADLRVRVVESGGGPFGTANQKLKNTYLVRQP
ncbi:MAG: phenylacetate--CoA ligase family protein [Pseudonocardiales bacterium]|nr:phenylacetate--CoA ligase family protein [Pseudonocardiales bacterium]